DLETIVAKAMKPEPARRYATADDLADDLERLLSLRPIAARPVSLPGRIVRFTRREPARALLGLLLILLAAGGGAAVLHFGPRLEQADRLEREWELERRLASGFIDFEAGRHREA